MNDHSHLLLPALFRATIVFLAITPLVPVVQAASIDDSIHRQTADAGDKQRQPTEMDELPPTPEDIEEMKRQEALATLVRQMRAKARSEVEARVKTVQKGDLELLAKALGVAKNVSANPGHDDAAISTLEALGDLDGDGVPEAVFRWSRLDRLRGRAAGAAEALPDWVLFLLSWDGHTWRVSELTAGSGLYDLRMLTKLNNDPAVAIVEGLTSVPYPTIFRYVDHAATLLWDSKDTESRYQGLAFGEVEFRDTRPDGPPAMLVSGKADPGVLHFPRASQRGFGVATLYLWDGQAYVPRKTEYSANEDYSLYRFISALHLHDFHTAYSLVDPAQFLAGEDKSLEAFRKYVEENLREFLANNIFAAQDSSEEADNKFRFQLSQDDAHFTYFPTFSTDSKFLLTRLERREEK